jgi:predicted TIM-barrel fold metal-dependent hydrolase
LLMNPKVREGFARLAALGLSFDAWMYHTQLGELVDLARAVPDTQIVLDHVGGPIGLGPYAGKRDEVFAGWSARIRELASCPNVHIKLGGLGMRMFGFTHHLGELPPSSHELAAAWRPYIETCIAAFGPERAMFESNFPVDKGATATTCCRTPSSASPPAAPRPRRPHSSQARRPNSTSWNKSSCGRRS